MNAAVWETLIAALRDPDDADRAAAARVARHTAVRTDDIPRVPGEASANAALGFQD